ncbi:MAG: LLM class flavin-dependent oxidoreductase, partial [Proteobacteria bacterium]|nr:LLM class flavin-dependent oxidoreductase [Pseudomonadota bacterium]
IAWFAEHHFSNYSLCASPLMLIAHVAPLTKRIRLGTAVVVAPLYNPARLVAEIATVDALTNGRLVLGIGSGYQPYEFERFGEDLAESAEMTEEMLEIIKLGLTQDFFTYDGKHYKLPKTHIAARPVQKSLPIYVAGHSVPLFRRHHAGRQAVPQRAAARDHAGQHADRLGRARRRAPDRRDPRLPAGAHLLQLPVRQRAHQDGDALDGAVREGGPAAARARARAARAPRRRQGGLTQPE